MFSVHLGMLRNVDEAVYRYLVDNPGRLEDLLNVERASLDDFTTQDLRVLGLLYKLGVIRELRIK